MSATSRACSPNLPTTKTATDRTGASGFKAQSSDPHKPPALWSRGQCSVAFTMSTVGLLESDGILPPFNPANGLGEPSFVRTGIDQDMVALGGANQARRAGSHIQGRRRAPCRPAGP